MSKMCVSVIRYASYANLIMIVNTQILDAKIDKIFLNVSYEE